MVEQAGLHWWSKNPKIPDGTNIYLAKMKPEPPEKPEDRANRVTVYDVVKDMTAIMVGALTIVVLIRQL
jgi:hypothetical protein